MLCVHFGINFNRICVRKKIVFHGEDMSSSNGLHGRKYGLQYDISCKLVWSMKQYFICPPPVKENRICVVYFNRGDLPRGTNSEKLGGR